jgi:hypothetical protein
LKEESVAKNPEEVLLSFWKLSVAARGGVVARVVGLSVAVLILAVAWRVVQ